MLKEVHVQLQTYAMNCAPIIGLSIRCPVGVFLQNAKCQRCVVGDIRWIWGGALY